MNRSILRLLVTLGALGIMGLVLFLIATGPGSPGVGGGGDDEQTSAERAAPDGGARDADRGDSDVADQADAIAADGVDASTSGDDVAADSDTTATPPDAVGDEPGIGAAPLGLRAVAPDGPPAEGTVPASLGSLDARTDRLLVEFARGSAGIERIAFSDYWETADASVRASRHWAALEEGATGEALPPLPDETERLILQEARQLPTASGSLLSTPILAARTLFVDDIAVTLFGERWSEREPGVFVTEIRDDDDQAILRVERRFELSPNGYDIALRQTVTNLSGEPRSVRWLQYGPGDIARDPSAYIDTRRFHRGYLNNATRDPDQRFVDWSGMMLERGKVLDRADGMATEPLANQLWPTARSRDEGLTLTWFGSTNRYFALAVHAPYNPPERPSKALGAVERIAPLAGADAEGRFVLTELYGPEREIAGGESASWDMGVYAGPLDRNLLVDTDPFASLGMRGLIVYVLSGCCTFCTFSWLANFLIVFLSFLHDSVVFDWGLAIITLVIIVRLLLHPLMKRSQIAMQRTTRAMQDLKPELDKLQKAYKDDPRRMQVEQMRLFRERGVNPIGCAGGMLPMFLQTPIWIALYATLYIAFELRQQPAFFGIFQSFGGWQFLGDLSAQDRFIAFSQPIDLGIVSIASINLLPLLMGAVFYVQQKYMTPPPSATMTPEQLQQQKIMKIMMVVLFPIMLYIAPSGLTLYILTSSTIGTIESRLIRRKVDRMDLTPKPKDPAKTSGKKGAMAKRMEEALRRAEEKRASKGRKPKQFKSRD